MKEVIYLVIAPDGVRKMRKTRPALAKDEFSIKINVAINDNLFKKPHFESDLNIANDQTELILTIAEMESQIKKLKENKTDLGVKK